MANLKKTRKRSILIENVNNNEFPKPRKQKENNNVFAGFFQYDANKKNRFIVELIDSNDNLVTHPDKILSFNLKNTESNQEFITIECMLQAGDWIDKLIKAEYCNLFILNSKGEIVNYFDFNITNSGYEYDLNSMNDDLFKPKIFYTII